MRNGRTQRLLITLGIIMISGVNGWAETAAALPAAASEMPFHTLVKDYTAQQIFHAAYDVMFKQLGLAKKKSQDCQCSANRVDLLTGRIEAMSADGISFTFRVHYLDEHSCGVWIHAVQDSEVPADLRTYCKMIFDRTAEKLAESNLAVEAAGGEEAAAMEFSGEYEWSIEQIYSAIREMTNHVKIGHNIRTRNEFTLAGNLISGDTRFSYKAYRVADDKLIFQFSRDSKGHEEAERYIFEKIYQEFQRQLDLLKLK